LRKDKIEVEAKNILIFLSVGGDTNLGREEYLRKDKIGVRAKNIVIFLSVGGDTNLGRGER